MMHECENQEDVQLELGGNTISKRNEQIWFANGSKTWLLIFIEFYNFFSLNPIFKYVCVCVYAHTQVSLYNIPSLVTMGRSEGNFKCQS